MYIVTTVFHSLTKNKTGTRLKAISPITLSQYTVFFQLFVWNNQDTNYYRFTTEKEKKERKKVWHQTFFIINMCVTVKTLAKQNPVWSLISHICIVASLKVNQNEWKVACSWSPNQRTKRTTVFKGHWIVDECTSSLLYGNPDEIRGGGADNKNNKSKKQNKKQTWGEPSFYSGAEPGGRLQCDRGVVAVCRAEHGTSAERYANAGLWVCARVWFAIGLCNVSACFSCSSCCCGWSPCIFWSRARANRKPPPLPAREKNHCEGKKKERRRPTKTLFKAVITRGVCLD